MSRITIEIARHVADLMVKKKTEKINSLKLELSESALSHHLKHVPPAVKKAFKENMSYIRTTNSIRLVGGGFNHEYIAIGIYAPSNGNDCYTPNEFDGEFFRRKIDKISQLKDERNSLREDIVQALKTLGTYKKVEAEFNEAYKLLPLPARSLPAIRIDKIIERL